MREGERWSVAAFEAIWLQHPLGRIVSTRLIWGAWVEGRLMGCFRITEDGSLADVEDVPFMLPTHARVGVLHPLEMPDRGAWSQLVRDYRLLQPFAQVDREGLPQVLAIPSRYRVMRGMLELRGW
jgi:hypothetical protein